MSTRMLSALAMLITVTGLLLLVPSRAAAAPPVFPNNPYPQSFYYFNPGYYGPYYPGQYQYGSVNPGVYNNSASPRFSGYGTSNSVPLQYSYPSYGSPPTFGSSPSSYAPPVTSYRYPAPIFSPPASGSSAPNATQVQAEVHLPTPNAELWVEGRKTTSTGAWRRFLSPSLVPGERYVYEFRARWFDNGREVLRSRNVPVRAGERIIIDFTTLPQGEAQATPLQTPARSSS